MTVPTTPYLKVEGGHITKDGVPIILKGAGLGGWSECLLGWAADRR